MLDDALEAVGPLSLDPVHHIAAIAGAERASVLGIDIGILRRSGREAQLQIFQRLATPILVDRVSEGLAIAGRAMEIDDHRGIAMGGERLGIPAIGPAVIEAALRPAMHQEGDRQLALGSHGLHDLSPDRVAIGALEAEALDRDIVHPGQLLRVDVGQAHRLAFRRHLPEIGRRLDAVQRIDETAIGQRHDATGMALLGEARHLARCGIDPEHRIVEHVIGGDQQPLAMRFPGDRSDRSIPALGQRARLAGGDVAQHQDQPIGFIAGPLHRGIGQPFAIGRHHRHRVGRIIGVGQVDRLGAAVGRHAENVEVGRQRLDPPGLAQGEEQRLAIRAPGQFLRSAERLGRAVADQAAHHRHRLAARDRHDEDLRTLAVAPRIPVAHEQLVIDPAAARAWRGRRLHIVDRARTDRPVGPQRHLVTLGVQQETGNAAGRLADLHRLTACDRRAPQLIVAAGVGYIIKRAAVSRKDRRCLILVGHRRDQPGRLPRLVDCQQIEVGAAAIIGEIRAAQLIGHPLAVRRYGRRRHPVQRHHVIGHERTGSRRRHQRRRQHRRQGQCAKAGKQDMFHGKITLGSKTRRAGACNARPGASMR